MFSLLFLVLFLNALTSVQSVDNIQANIVSEYSKTDEALWSKNQKLNKHDFHTDTLLMDFLQTTNSFKDNSYDFTLKELRNALTKILKKNKVQKRHVADRIGNRHRDQQHDNKGKSHIKWDNWTSWSACSVTCGKGRHIRWRHCKENCKDGVETEMQEKACQLPACPHKLFGLIKI